MSGIVKKIKDSGNPDVNCLNIVLMAEGYLASQQVQFDADCASKVAALFADPNIKGEEYKLNVYSVFYASNQSGITNPKAITGQPILEVDTYFKCSFWAYGIQREIAPQDRIVNGVTLTGTVFVTKTMNDAIPASANKINYLASLVAQTPYYGGAEVGATSISTLHPLGNEVLLHELPGHTIAGVGDEFVGGQYVEERNATQKTPVSWAAIYSGTPVVRGAWKVPTSNCKMNTLGTETAPNPFCVVCAYYIKWGIDFYITRSGGTIPTAPVIPPTPAKPDLTLFPQFTIPATQVIAPNIHATPNPDNYRCLIDWKAVPNCPNYIIQWSYDGSFWNSSMSNTNTSATIKNLLPKRSIQIQMCCDYYSGIHGAFSPVQTITTL